MIEFHVNSNENNYKLKLEKKREKRENGCTIGTRKQILSNYTFWNYCTYWTNGYIHCTIAHIPVCTQSIHKTQ